MLLIIVNVISQHFLDQLIPSKAYSCHNNGGMSSLPNPITYHLKLKRMQQVALTEKYNPERQVALHANRI